jgi:hypothetical protein
VVEIRINGTPRCFLGFFVRAGTCIFWENKYRGVKMDWPVKGISKLVACYRIPVKRLVTV